MVTEQEFNTLLIGVVIFNVALWVTSKYFPRFVIVPFLAFTAFGLWFLMGV